MATLEELQRDHPEWNVVQVIEGPGGQGQLAVGADGGVFALGGAEFSGSYQGLAPEQRQGTRSFTGIRLNEQGGGYTLISDQPGQEYAFSGNQAPAGTTTPPPASTAPQEEEGASARALLHTLLEGMGLPISLADSMWKSSLTKGPEEIAADVRASPEYKARYPGMEGLKKNGRVIDEGTYRRLEEGIKGTMAYYGLPEGFHDSPDDFAKLISGEVSPKELEERIQMAATAAYTAPPEFRQELERFGLSTGDLVAYFLDPPTATAFIERKVLFGQAEIGTKSREVGFGLLTKDEAERLRVTGMTADQAGAALTEAGAYQGFTQRTAEESMAGEGLTREDLIGSAAGDLTDQADIRRAQERRRARFGGGGGAATGGQGGTGLGSA